MYETWVVKEENVVSEMCESWMHEIVGNIDQEVDVCAFEVAQV